MNATPSVGPAAPRRTRTRKRGVPRKPAPAGSPPAGRPAALTRAERVLLLREYRDAECLTPEERRLAVAWIVDHDARAAGAVG